MHSGIEILKLTYFYGEDTNVTILFYTKSPNKITPAGNPLVKNPWGGQTGSAISNFLVPDVIVRSHGGT